MKVPFVDAGFIAIVGLSAVGLNAAESGTAGLRQPAEFEPQAGVWMSPVPDDPDFTNATVAFTKALQSHVAVKMLVADDKSLAKTKAVLQQNGVGLDGIEFHVAPLATYFIRDGAVYLVNAHGARSVLDLKWSDYGLPGWCRRVYAGYPERIAKCIGYVNPAMDGIEGWFAKVAGATVVNSPLILENATFEVNGQGVLVISEVLALQRNDGLNREDIERELLVLPGVKKVIWLGEGLAEDPQGTAKIEGRYVGMGAGGHTDEFVRFTDAHTILLAWEDDASPTAHPVQRINRERMQKNYDILARSTDQEGKPFRIIKVPMPAVIERKVVLAPKSDQSSALNEVYFPASDGLKAGDEVIQIPAATYLNFLVANDVVLVPSFVEEGTSPAVQERVRHIFEDAFPGRSIKFIHCTPLMWNGGGLHCATLSEPGPGKPGHGI